MGSYSKPLIHDIHIPDEEINGKSLLQLDDSEIKQLIPKMGPRKNFSYEFKVIVNPVIQVSSCSPACLINTIHVKSQVTFVTMPFNGHL